MKILSQRGHTDAAQHLDKREVSTTIFKFCENEDFLKNREVLYKKIRETRRIGKYRWIILKMGFLFANEFSDVTIENGL